MESTAIQEPLREKANQRVAKPYDDAHTKAPYGGSDAETPEMGMIWTSSRAG